MTRVQKNKHLRKKHYFKEYIKTLLYFIIGVIYIIYLLIKNINKIVIKLFKKLPKILKVIIIYTMIILSILYIIKPRETIIYKQKVLKENIVINNNNNNDNIEQTNTIIDNNNSIDLQNDNANNIYNKAIEKGLSKEQAVLVVSISRHETGNWTSKAFNDKNNFGGIMCNHASEIKRYSTYEEGLNDFIRILKTYYFDMGLNEIAAIGAKYCPVGAKNDPNGLNKYWVGGVTEFYNYYMQLV